LNVREAAGFCRERFDAFGKAGVCPPESLSEVTFSHLDQFLCMAFAQLTLRESLRDIRDWRHL
jgi:hypothetical protein